MIKYRYFLGDESEEDFFIDIDQLMDSLVDPFLEKGDINQILQQLLYKGYQDKDNRHYPGLLHLLHQLQQKRQELLEKYDLNSLYKDIKDTLQNLTAEKKEQLRKFLRELNEILRERIAGAQPDFSGFMKKYGSELPEKYRDMSLDELIEQLQKEIAQLDELKDMMPTELRQSLEQLLQQSYLSFNQDLREELAEFTKNIQKLTPLMHYPFWGEEPLDMGEALKVKEQLDQIEYLESIIKEIRNRSKNLEDLDPQLIKKIIGEQGKRYLDNLKLLTKKLEDAGYISYDDKGFKMTPQGIRKIGQKALQDIFSRLKKDQFGNHPTSFIGSTGGERIEETKRYEYSDPFDLHLTNTLKNTLRREKRREFPLKIDSEDFEVHKQEYQTQNALVLMLDMSGSMDRYRKFVAAKKVALAVERLIQEHFPRDNFRIVGFYTRAQEIKIKDLPYINPKPFGFASFMWLDYFNSSWGPLTMDTDYQAETNSQIPQAFTNIQEGLKLSREILSRQKGYNKQIIMVTDGEPTAHLEGDKVYLQYPPSKKTIQETLKEVKKCTQAGIIINTFMLSKDPFLENFVDQITLINKGRAFYTTPEKIGEYIVVDYLRRKRRKIS
jgi:uncharacterized protein with von Willebrand factor type A (vWA) domain